MSIDPVSLAIAVALNAATMAMTMSQKIEGPRVTDLNVTVADYGTPMPYFRGRRRLECPCFWSEPIKEVRRKRKTKGGKYNEYTYYGTFAILIAGHEIENVLKVWFDRHLIYDASGTGPIFTLDSTMIVKHSSYFTFYNGADDQEIDERMEATDTVNFGAGTTPAYRGRAYLMFKDVPLEKVGNRLPQVSVEAQSVADPIYPYLTMATIYSPPNRLWGIGFSPNGSRVMWTDGDYFEIWDNTAHKRMASGNLGMSTGLAGVTPISNTGVFYRIADAGIYGYPADGHGSPTLVMSNVVEGVTYQISNPQIVLYAGSTEVLCCQGFSIHDDYFVDRTLRENPGYQVLFFFADTYGNVWSLGAPYGSTSTLVFNCEMQYSTGARPTTGSVDTGSTVGGVLHDTAGLHYGGHFIAAWNGVLYKISDQDFSIVATLTVSLDVYNTYKQFACYRVGHSTLWLNETEIDLDTFTVRRTVNMTDWINPPLDADGIVYDPYNNALITFPQYDYSITWRYLDRTSTDGVTLRSIVEAIADMAGLSGAGIDAADLTDLVIGYSWSQGPAKDIIQPLLELHDCLARPHNFQLQFIQRGDSPTLTIDSAYMVPSDKGEAYEIRTINDTDLPRKLFISFADVDGDQQPNTAISQRSADAVDSARDVAVDLTSMAGASSTIQQYTERVLRRRWFSSATILNRLTPMHLAIEPGDVQTLSLDGDEITVLATKMTIGADDVMTLEWERDSAELHTLSGSEGAVMEGRTPSEILAPVSTRGFILDLPLLSDNDNTTNPFFYIAAGPYNDGFWPGADFARSGDAVLANYAPGWDSVNSTDAASWGYVQGTMPDGIATVIDEGTVLTVLMYQGALNSVTQAELDASATLNMAIVGNEIIQFRDAVAVATDTYEISGIVRGARGTEQYTVDHDPYDFFLLVDSAMHLHAMAISEVGQTAYYRAHTNLTDISDGFEQSITFQANSHRPLSPAHVTLTLSGSDWIIAWHRRTRIGGALVDGRDVALGETTEAYEVDILNGTAVMRTISVTSETATYTSAQQTTDFGSPQTSLSVKVRQMNVALGLDGIETAASG